MNASYLAAGLGLALGLVVVAVVLLTVFPYGV